LFSTFRLFISCSAVAHVVSRIMARFPLRKTGIYPWIGAPIVDLGAPIGDVAAGNRSMVGTMMRIGSVAISIAFAGAFSLSAAGAGAQTPPQGLRMAQVEQPGAADNSAQRRPRRPPTRLRVYPSYVPGGVDPRYFPGRNALRECNVNYVQEYRPSGTVIVPRMSCVWRGG
jgi:hypothetical protein